MASQLLTEKYDKALYGVLHCYDRIIISGNLHPLCYAQGMTGYLYAHGIRIFDYASEFAQPLCELIRSTVQTVAQEQKLQIEFIANSRSFRKEERIQKILRARGDHPGLVHIFSQWSDVQLTDPGTTRKRTSPTSDTAKASACTITCTSSTPSWGCAICVFRPGVLFVCSSISTVTTG